MNPPPMPKEVPLLHDLVNDYLRYKNQGYPETALRVLYLIKQTVDDVIDYPGRFAVASTADLDIVDKRTGIIQPPAGSKPIMEVLGGGEVAIKWQAEPAAEQEGAVKEPTRGKTGFAGIDEAIETIDRVTDVASGKRKIGETVEANSEREAVTERDYVTEAPVQYEKSRSFNGLRKRSQT